MAIDPISLAMGLMGGKGGETNVSQTATNTTGLSISNVISMASPGNLSAPVTGGTSSGASSGAGSQPLPSSSLAFPLEATTSTPGSAELAEAAGLTPSVPPQLLLLGAAAAVALFMFARKKPRRGN